MKLRELLDAIPVTQEIVVWSIDRDGEEEEVYGGAADDCYSSLDLFEVFRVEVDDGALSITIDELPLGYDI